MADQHHNMNRAELLVTASTRVTVSRNVGGRWVILGDALGEPGKAPIWQVIHDREAISEALCRTLGAVPRVVKTGYPQMAQMGADGAAVSAEGCRPTEEGGAL